MKKIVIIFTIFFLAFGEFGEGARILASVGTPSYSHQVAFRTIWKELAKRGHEIILLTTDPMKENIKNLRQVDMSSSYDVMNKYNFTTSISNNFTNDFWEFVTKSTIAIAEANRHQLQMAEVQALIQNSSEHFDLLMLEVVFPTHLGLVERFKAPIIGVVSLDAHRIWHGVMGNDDHPVFHPQIGLSLSQPPNLLERTTSVVLNSLMHMYTMFYAKPLMTQVIKDVFGENSRSIHELMKEIDMLFLNINPILHPIRAVTPNTILFGGGTHVDFPKPLPEKIQKFLDNATQGAIYFSLGSNVRSNLIKGELRQVFMETLNELPYKILWKFENEELPNKPDNVMIQKWLPQSDVLRHPNIKAFITQCGLQSMEEAIMNHVPLVGLPFYADQPANAIMMHNKGFGINLDHTQLTKKLFKESILEVVNNPKYKERTIEIAKLTRDVEMTGLEKVVWWTEYVIRNKGAKLFRNPIADLPFYQYYLLDVIGFISLICIIATYILIRISSIMCTLIRRHISNKLKKE